MVEQKTPRVQIDQKDFKPLIVGIGMLLLAAVIGYTLGFRSAQGVLTASPGMTETAPKPTMPPAAKQKQQKPLSIPADWKTYDSFFGVATFSFRYPPGYAVSDTNVRTGQIYVFLEDSFSFPAPLVIDTLSRTFYFQEYQSGSVKDWFLKNIQIVYPDTDFSSLTVETVSGAEGTSYLKVSNWPETTKQINPNLFSGTWYIMADVGISYYMVDNNILDDKDVERVLSTLEVKTE